VVSVANRAQPVMSKPESSKDATRNDAVTDTHSNVRGKAFEKRDFTLNDDLLGRFQFTLAGREMVNGRPMLILDFRPANKKLPERHIKDKFINKAAGRLWVDEADYVLAKADVHLTETVNVFGGLVGADDSRRRVSQPMSRTHRGCREAAGGDSTGGRLVRGNNSDGANGAFVRFRAQPHPGRGNVAALRVLSRLQPHCRAVAQLPQP